MEKNHPGNYTYHFSPFLYPLESDGGVHVRMAQVVLTSFPGNTEGQLSLTQLGITGQKRPNVIYESLKYILLTLLLGTYYSEILVCSLKDKNTRMEITALCNSNDSDNKNNNSNNNLKVHQ